MLWPFFDRFWLSLSLSLIVLSFTDCYLVSGCLMTNRAGSKALQIHYNKTNKRAPVLIGQGFNQNLWFHSAFPTAGPSTMTGPHIMLLDWNHPSVDKNTDLKLFINANKLYQMDWLSWVRNPDISSISRLVKSNLFISPPSVFSGQLRTR